MKMQNFATLREDSPFYPLFPNGQVPIKNILFPSKAECVGYGVQDVYMVDVPKLTPEQLERVLCMITAHAPHQREECRRDIASKGLPLRAKHVQSVSSNNPFFL